MRDTEIVTGCLSGYTAVDTLSESCDRTPATAHQITKGSLSLPLQAVTMTIAIVILNDIISYYVPTTVIYRADFTSRPLPDIKQELCVTLQTSTLNNEVQIVYFARSNWCVCQVCDRCSGAGFSIFTLHFRHFSEFLCTVECFFCMNLPCKFL